MTRLLMGMRRDSRLGRLGDNLVCLFQCDLCHFQNIMKREPIGGDTKYRLLLQCIQCTTSFQGTKRLEEIGDTMGLESVTLPMGPYSTDKSFGMGLVVCILIWTMDPGKTEDLIQFSTAK
jgi:hypothetical protein